MHHPDSQAAANPSIKTHTTMVPPSFVQVFDEVWIAGKHRNRAFQFSLNPHRPTRPMHALHSTPPTHNQPTNTP